MGTQTRPSSAPRYRWRSATSVVKHGRLELRMSSASANSSSWTRKRDAVRCRRHTWSQNPRSEPKRKLKPFISSNVTESLPARAWSGLTHR